MRRLFVLCWLLLAGALAAGQQAPTTWEVYTIRGVTASGLDRLTFVDILTGRIRTTEVPGERYTILGETVVYFDYVANRTMMVGVDGIPRPHPFVQITADARRIDWVVSVDGRFVAWTLTFGTPEALITRTYVANYDGSDRREVLEDGPRAGLRALPVAFTADETHLIMDAQPDGIGQYSAYTQYAGLFSVSLVDGSITSLPGEPACFCGAGFAGDQFVRLALTQDLRGFDLVIRNLATDTAATIPAQTPLASVTQAGDVLISPDGSMAVYALSNIANFGTTRQSIQTVFMLADLNAMTQRPLTDPITTFVHPVRWTDDNSAILFTSPQVNGTWKILLADGDLRKVANEKLIGLLVSDDPS